MPRNELINIMRCSGEESFDKQFKFLVIELQKRTNCNEKEVINLNKKLTHFKSQYRSRWSKAFRRDDKLKKK